MVRRGLAPTRTAAQRLVEEGRVLVERAPATKASHLVAPHEAVVVAGPPPRYVGRGGAKLEAALSRFGVGVSGVTALDAGASTGGFTDCLLQHGAARVVAVDVGRGQMHERLRQDPRVDVRERTDIRTLGGRAERFPLVVADLSFISIRSVAAALVAAAEPGADLIVLVKPQFEAGRAEVSRGRGVIRDPEVWRATLREAISAMERAGAVNMGVMVSPLRGADGNVEFLTWFRAAPAGGPARALARFDAAIDAAIEAAVAERATPAGMPG